jgi:outer membrane usher protein
LWSPINRDVRVELFLPLYSSTDLLGRGLFDFNLEVGAERQQYATESFDYGPRFASGSVSYGVSDRLTLRGYGAGSRDYWMGAAGATFSLGRLFLVDTAAMYSHRPEEDGWSLYGSVEHVSGPLSLYGSYTHSSPGFRDLAGEFGYTTFTDQVTASAGCCSAGSATSMPPM